MSLSPDTHSSDKSRAGSQRDSHRSRGTLHELFHSISDHDLFGRSAQLAYYFFFAVFPGLIFLSALLAILSGPHSPLHSSLMRQLPQSLPPKAVNLLQHTLQQTHNGGGKITFGVLVALWSATAGMAAVCKVLNVAHEVKEGRPYWKVRLTALLLTIVSCILILCAIAVMFWGHVMVQQSAGESLHPLIVGLIRAAQWGAAIVAALVIFALIYTFAPDVGDRKWRWITPGAGLGVGLWILATVGLTFYLRYFHSFSATYGSLGAVIVLLTWFYIAGFALLAGAEVNAIRENKAAKQGDPEAAEKGEKSPHAA